MRKFLIFLFLTASAVSVVFAQGGGLHSSGNKTESNISYDLIDKDVIKKLDKFFQKIISDNIEAGYDDLLKNSPIVLKKDDLSNLIKQTSRSIEVYGKIQGFEYVNSEIITESFIRLRYLALHANYPMRWVFTFYRSPEKSWIVSNIKLDDQSEIFFSYLNVFSM
jgi:hypothetical protein